MKRLNNKVNYGDKILGNTELLNLKNSFRNDWMDAECVDLSDTLNSIKGIETVESCCGHNYEPYRIFFKCYELPALRFIQSCIDKRYWKYGGQWKITTSIADVGPEPLDFVLESTSSNLNEIMTQVEDMIIVINYYLNHKNRFELLGLDYANFIFEEVYGDMK
jgi:hypothetical protein